MKKSLVLTLIFIFLISLVSTISCGQKEKKMEFKALQKAKEIPSLKDTSPPAEKPIDKTALKVGEVAKLRDIELVVNEVKVEPARWKEGHSDVKVGLIIKNTSSSFLEVSLDGKYINGELKSYIKINKLTYGSLFEGQSPRLYVPSPYNDNPLYLFQIKDSAGNLNWLTPIDKAKRETMVPGQTFRETLRYDVASAFTSSMKLVNSGMAGALEINLVTKKEKPKNLTPSFYPVYKLGEKASISGQWDVTVSKEKEAAVSVKKATGREVQSQADPNYWEPEYVDTPTTAIALKISLINMGNTDQESPQENSFFVVTANGEKEIPISGKFVNEDEAKTWEVLGYAQREFPGHYGFDIEEVYKNAKIAPRVSIEGIIVYTLESPPKQCYLIILVGNNYLAYDLGKI